MDTKTQAGVLGAEQLTQILVRRERAAERRVQQRQEALVKATAGVQLLERVDPKLGVALAEAREALAGARRERQTLSIAVYEPATSFAVGRYAAVLMWDDSTLSAAEALQRAWEDERALATHWIALNGPDDEDDDE